MAATDVIIKCEEFLDSEENIEDINKSLFNDFDERRDDSEPENDENHTEVIENANDDIKLQELLREFDLEILFTLLKFSDITYRSLMFLSENDINTAIRSIAYRAEFREKLFAWRRDKYGLNDISVLPPPKQTPMPLGVNNSNNVPSASTNANRVTNSPFKTTTSTKPTSGVTAPRAKRPLKPKTSAAKKARITYQAEPTKRASIASPTRTPSCSMDTPTSTLSEAMSIAHHETSTRPSMDFDEPLCFKPTTSSAAAAATKSSMTSTTDSLLYEQPTDCAEFFEPRPENSLLVEQPKTAIGKQPNTTKLSQAEIQKRYREKRKLNKLRDEEYKRKHNERNSERERRRKNLPEELLKSERAKDAAYKRAYRAMIKAKNTQPDVSIDSSFESNHGIKIESPINLFYTSYQSNPTQSSPNLLDKERLTH